MYRTRLPGRLSTKHEGALFSWKWSLEQILFHTFHLFSHVQWSVSDYLLVASQVRVYVSNFPKLISSKTKCRTKKCYFTFSFYLLARNHLTLACTRCSIVFRINFMVVETGVFDHRDHEIHSAYADRASRRASFARPGRKYAISSLRRKKSTLSRRRNSTWIPRAHSSASSETGSLVNQYSFYRKFYTNNVFMISQTR